MCCSNYYESYSRNSLFKNINLNRFLVSRALIRYIVYKKRIRGKVTVVSNIVFEDYLTRLPFIPKAILISLTGISLYSSWSSGSGSLNRANNFILSEPSSFVLIQLELILIAILLNWDGISTILLGTTKWYLDYDFVSKDYFSSSVL